MNIDATVKVLMLKGEKGEKGDGVYDDSQIRADLTTETTERQRADATLGNRIDELIVENTTNATGWQITYDEKLGGLPSSGVSTTTFDVPKNSVVVEIAWKNAMGAIPATYNTDGIQIIKTSGSTTDSITVKVETESTINVKLTYAYPQTLSLAELEDIRVGYDGTVYGSAGDAVRGQIGAIVAQENPAMNYSTSEKQIGTWIDGKPLYQKTIEMTGDFSTSQNYNVPDADVLMIIDGFFECSASNKPYYLPLNYAESGYITYTGYVADTQNLYFHVNGFNSSKVTATIRYTKTTD